MIIQLLRFCLTSTAFLYRGQHYKQPDYIAMGSPVSPIIADIFMEYLEDKTFATYNTTPRIWYRFVHDVISVAKKHNVQGLLQHLNKQHGRIQFTMEMENSGSLPFMDIRITRQPQGELTKEVYQKPTHSNRYIPFSSHHPISVKSGVVACLANCAIRVSSSQAGRDAELGLIKGYDAQRLPKKVHQQSCEQSD